jgi:CBS domain containing-hemolysin-like protein
VVVEPGLAHLLEALLPGGVGTMSAHAFAVTIALVVMNLLHVVVGEQAPTYLGIERTKTISKYLAPGLHWWTRLLRPVIRTVDWTAQSLLSLFGVAITRSWTEAETEGEDKVGEVLMSHGAVRREIGKVLSRANLSRERRSEILRAVDIEHIPVRVIIVPRSEIVALRAPDDLRQNLQRMRNHPHNRYPFLHSDWESVYDTLYMATVFRHLPALERGDIALRGLAEPVSVNPELPISDLIDRPQKRRQEIVLVCTDGHSRGLVTSADAFEAIAGGLEDPSDVGREPRSRQGPEPVSPSASGARPWRAGHANSTDSGARGGGEIERSRRELPSHQDRRSVKWAVPRHQHFTFSPGVP